MATSNSGTNFAVLSSIYNSVSSSLISSVASISSSRTTSPLASTSSSSNRMNSPSSLASSSQAFSSVVTASTSSSYYSTPSSSSQARSPLAASSLSTYSIQSSTSTWSSTTSTSSSSSLGTSLSSVASSSASPAATGSCAQLAANSNLYFDSNGVVYTIQCNYDHGGGDLGNMAAASFSDCFSACDKKPGCIAFSYLGGSGAGNCYFKTSLNPGQAAPGVDFALRGSSGASTSSSTLYSRGVTTELWSPIPSLSSFSTLSISSSGSLSSPKNLTSYLPSTSPTFTSTSMPTFAPYISSTTSSGAAPSCSSATNLCPMYNGTTYYDCNGAQYRVLCDTNQGGIPLDGPGYREKAKARRATQQPSFAACMDLCDDVAGCVGAAYTGANCQLYSSLAGAPSSSPGTVFGLRSGVAGGLSSVWTVSSTISTSASAPVYSSTGICPAMNNTVYTDDYGQKYEIICGTNHQGGDLEQIPGSSIPACISACTASGSCVGIVFITSSQLCCLKQSIVGAGANDSDSVFALLLSLYTGGGVQPIPVTSSTGTSLSRTSGSSVTSRLPATFSFNSSTSSHGLASSGVVRQSTVTVIPSQQGTVTVTICPACQSSPITASIGASVCYTCGITPTLITGPVSGRSGPENGVCSKPSTRTTTVFTTYTTTTCPTPLTCPVQTWLIGGDGSGSSSGSGGTGGSLGGSSGSGGSQGSSGFGIDLSWSSKLRS